MTGIRHLSIPTQTDSYWLKEKELVSRFIDLKNTDMEVPVGYEQFEYPPPRTICRFGSHCSGYERGIEPEIATFIVN